MKKIYHECLSATLLLILMTLTIVPTTVKAQDDCTRFNVATYNLRLLTDADVKTGNGWTQREPYVASLIRFHGFDIFGTQEGMKPQLDTLRRDLPGYEYIGVGRDDGKEKGEYAAIFYDTKKFELLDHGDFWLSETPDRPGKGWDAECVRVCTWGKFRHRQSGREFMFYNLHMDHIGTVARSESAKLIIRKIEEANSPLPTFVTGDFNVDQTSPAYRTILSGGKLQDSHDKAFFVYQNNGTFNDYATDTYTTSRIDHVFVTPDIMVEKYGVLTDTYRSPRNISKSYKGNDAPGEIDMTDMVARTPSDHFPVMAVITICDN